MRMLILSSNTDLESKSEEGEEVKIEDVRRIIDDEFWGLLLMKTQRY
jgi:hypothetical protein